jgi:alpha-1,3-glucan synthase
VTDNFILRVGQANNPIVFPRTANVSDTLLHKDGSGKLYISHQAPGAELFRYSTNFESTYSDWIPYGNGGNYSLAPTVWSGTDQQKWEGDHVTVQYWSSIAGSASHRQDADLGLPDGYPPHRRWPHVFMMGPFNLFGFDAGVENNMVLGTDGNWTYNFMEDWPSQLQANIWGINPDKQPDQSFVYGDVDGDNVLDRLPPSSLAQNMMNVTEGPLPPYLSWKVVINDGSRRFVFVPQGSRHLQMTLFALLWVIPPVTAMLAVFIFKRSFYQVKFNTEGAKSMTSFIPLLPLKKLFSRGNKDDAEKGKYSAVNALTPMTNAFDILGAMGGKKPGRRTVLIATLEYDISDWNIKIKIGGLGVMAQLMGKNLKHQDLVWVVPCVGDVEYPKDVDGEPIEVTILKQKYSIDVTYHQLENIKYILLDAPVFRRQTTKEPYPPRMDDLESAIFYSAWNQCIAQVITRFPIDLYHINDYHGALAPVYLLPDVIPCAVSLHNAEFQGLWPLRTPQEKEEVCSVYNITEDVCSRYVQFGNVFNLLHAGISYLRIHQKGFGAVGVSDKYGKRSWARYPIFWGLSKIGKLPNPDPSDTGAFDSAEKSKAIVVDREFEAKRADLKRQAQEWAGLHTDPDAELLVFVGRWSMQKGIDLIADLAPTLLEEFNVQLLCVGPVIDLYGRFAAEKLNHLMNMYPGRVFSRPEFTALPPYIFSGAEFALIPSRDEPFGLVAVEFGRKGALGIGAKVGGLGQMPGWWYTIESTTTKHLLTQFEHACREGLASDRPTRELMRAKSAKQRFPVVEWVRKLDKLQSTAIKMCERSKKRPGTSSGNKGFRQSLQKFGVPPKSSHGSEKGLGITMSPNPSVTHLTPPLQRDPHRESYASSAASDPYDDPYDAGGEGTRTPTYPPQRNASDTSLRDMGDDASSIEIPRRGIIEPPPKGSSLSRKLSLGTRLGPGHTSQQRHASMATIESLGPIDEEQHYAMPGDDDDDEYMYSAAAIRRQMAKNVGSKRGPGYTDGNESSDVESDYAPTPDNASLFEFDPQRSSVYDMGTRGTDSMYFDEDPYNANNPYNTPGDYFSNMPRNENVGLGVYAAEDPEQAPLHGERRTGYAAGLSPPVTPFARMSQSHLSLASVTGGRDDFALSNVKENFTDADGKYFKVFSSELHKIDPKTSKEDLCIEEYIMKSEKEWSKDQLNKKLGLDHMGSDAKGYKMPPSSHLSDDGRLTVSPPESHADEPLFGYKRPSGVRLLLQRRIGDWPVYSFLLALVSPISF